MEQKNIGIYVFSTFARYRQLKSLWLKRYLSNTPQRQQPMASEHGCSGPKELSIAVVMTYIKSYNNYKHSPKQVFTPLR